MGMFDILSRFELVYRGGHGVGDNLAQDKPWASWGWEKETTAGIGICFCVRKK